MKQDVPIPEIEEGPMAHCARFRPGLAWHHFDVGRAHF